MNISNMLDNYEIQKEINKKLPFEDIYTEIRKILNAHDITMNSFALGIPDCDERYCLHVEDGLWVTYFSERGTRSGLCVFCNVHDAVNFFIWFLLKSKLPEINWRSIDLFRNI
ncbi:MULTISPECIES: hypothetical protein [Photorhabdus]|uniref:hypothetical protein n=1 Tax=Photorhabdus TaxID=29487 RepID=UPI000CFA7A07|nr:hypothetical protein [Photorhabdus aegyptia]MCC8459410.1 hypothetical protein [Photorhabdus aegyptia]PQQ23506.1 hypothetical protein C6H64_22580 [Photorhabdus luminescens]PQQ33850.1 hypothetical protein C6H69_08180 [Photorhabdus luminescens]